MEAEIIWAHDTNLPKPRGKLKSFHTLLTFRYPTKQKLEIPGIIGEMVIYSKLVRKFYE